MLEFEKVAEQVDAMSETLSEKGRDLEAPLREAREILKDEAKFMVDVDRRIDQVRNDDAGYRGAAPMRREDGQESLDARIPPGDAPDLATLIAVDGSQVYPDPHKPYLYYLINTGAFIYHHGEPDRRPEQITYPELFYEDGELYANQNEISNAIVNKHRSLREMQMLAELAELSADDHWPLIVAMDGPVLWFGSIRSDEKSPVNVKDYLEAMVNIRDGGGWLLGYIDKPRSTYVIRLVHLLSLGKKEKFTVKDLETSGRFEGLLDWHIFGYGEEAWLKPGERSALFVQQSPSNRDFREHDRENKTGEDLEVATFYVNVGTEKRPHIARVEVPMWVARQKEWVGQIHALLLEQVRLFGNYPYMFVRADELAVVRGYEQSQLDEMIQLAMQKRGHFETGSAKDFSKKVAR